MGLTKVPLASGELARRIGRFLRTRRWSCGWRGGATVATAYDVLGVTRDASGDQIRQAYRRLAQVHHPDHHAGAPAEAIAAAARRFTEISSAWEILRDPERRRRYDEGLDIGVDEHTAHEAADQPPLTARTIVIHCVQRSAQAYLQASAQTNDSVDIATLLIGASLHALDTTEGVEHLRATGAVDDLNLVVEAVAARNSLCLAMDDVASELLEANSGTGGFYPAVRAFYLIAEGAAEMISNTFLRDGVTDYARPVVTLNERLDALNRRFHGGALDGSPTRPCQICGSGPTRVFTFRENRGFILARRRLTFEGSLCRGCALTAGRDMQASLLTRGWWGLRSALVTPYYALSNISQLRLAGALPQPRVAVTSLTPPLTPGPPVTRRHAPLIATGVALVLLIIGIAIAAASSNSTGRTGTTGTPTSVGGAASWSVGSCVSGSSMVWPVPCSSPHTGKIIGRAASQYGCPAYSESYVSSGGVVWCIDEDS